MIFFYDYMETMFPRKVPIELLMYGNPMFSYPKPPLIRTEHVAETYDWVSITNALVWEKTYCVQICVKIKKLQGCEP